ncbi:hypothetical protein E3J61_01880 [Candidatus Dependentiae bacterium]|nr:MAG: hypothetical protein E3J61_01880 [Candidatus Dependentiae bacterium]
MKIKLTFSLLLLMSSSLALSMDCNRSWDERRDGEKLCIIGAVSAVVVGGTYLLYKLFTWEASNEKVLRRAQHLYDTLNDAYKGMDLMDKVETLSRYTEQDLATIAFHRDVTMLASVASDLRSLQNERNTLRFRVRRDAGKRDATIVEMRALMSDIKPLELKLKLLKQFWSEHASFFDLYHYIKTLADCYEDARTDVYEAELVRRAIMALSVNTNRTYPCLHFAETLKRDIDGLKCRMSNAHRYDVLYGKAERLCESLVGLLGTAASLPEYKEELRLQKQHQLEQERVDAMRQKAEAERMKAEAFAQQAAAEREKANAMHHQAWATMAKPAAPPTQVTVNLNSRDGVRDADRHEY